MTYELGKRYRTRKGGPKDYGIVVMEESDDTIRVFHTSDKKMRVHRADGFYAFKSAFNLLDEYVEPKPPVVEHRFVNVYPEHVHNAYFAVWYYTLDEAKKDRAHSNIGIIKVTITDGKLTGAEVVGV